MKRTEKKRCSTHPRVCNDLPKSKRTGKRNPNTKLIRILKEQNAAATLAEKKRFADQIDEANRTRPIVLRRWSKLDDENDIIALIRDAIDNGQVNEAIWRCFLTAHFGRPSARGVEQVQSAARFLCAFRNRPFWTWKRTSTELEAFEYWLWECSEELETLRFGNHRKYESPRPELIFETIESFISLVKEFGSIKKLISLDEDEFEDGFDVIYKRLRPIVRFGRTGRFDFLLLLNDLKLFPNEPKSCYLRGSTGPRKGAKLLWGDHKPKALDELASKLSEELGISPAVVEDALCNWQK